jgi:hypothetical protein
LVGEFGGEPFGPLEGAGREFSQEDEWAGGGVDGARLFFVLARWFGDGAKFDFGGGLSVVEEAVAYIWEPAGGDAPAIGGANEDPRQSGARRTARVSNEEEGRSVIDLLLQHLQLQMWLHLQLLVSLLTGERAGFYYAHRAATAVGVDQG